MKKITHINNGACPKCQEIVNRWPGFHLDLLEWFKGLQKNTPEAHISHAGRGREEQEFYFKNKASRAHYGESAHNYNCALDIFKLLLTGANWDRNWFYDVIYPAVKACKIPLKWYGEPGSKFFELPHVEVAEWRVLAQQGKVKLVE